MVQVGCREASGVREMQDTKQKGWVTPHHRSPRLACCKPGGRAIFFFFFIQLGSYGGGGGGWEEREQIAILGLREAGELERSRRQQEREPSRAPKAINSQQMDTTKPYKTPPAQPIQTVRIRRAKRPGYIVTGCPDTKYPPCLSFFKYCPFHGCNCNF